MGHESGTDSLRFNSTIKTCHTPPVPERTSQLDLAELPYTLHEVKSPDSQEKIYVFELHTPFYGQNLSNLLQATSKNGPFPIDDVAEDWYLPHTVRRIGKLREKFDKPLVRQEDEHGYERLYRIHAQDPVIGETFSALTQFGNAELLAIRSALYLKGKTTDSNSKHLLKHAVYPVVAVAVNPDGTMRPVTKKTLKAHNYPFTYGSRSSVALGNALLAYFSPEVTDAWDEVMELEQGNRPQTTRQVQLIVLANLPQSQEAYLHGRLLTQLLAENGIPAASSVEEA